MIFILSLQMWRLSLFGQQSPAAPYWRSCAAEEMNSAITDVSYAASQIPNLKSIHSKAIVSSFILYFTLLCIMRRNLQLIVISSRMRIDEWFR